MKKIAICLVIALLLCGCIPAGPGNAEPVNLDMTLEELIEAIYEAHPMGELSLFTMPVDLNDEYAPSTYLGLESTDGVAEAVFSEPMINAQAYSLVICRVEDPANAPTIAQQMRSGINPRKWICVEADDLQVVYCGDLVMLVMIASTLSDIATSQDLVDAFSSVIGRDVTAVGA